MRKKSGRGGGCSTAAHGVGSLGGVPGHGRGVVGGIKKGAKVAVVAVRVEGGKE